MQCCADTHTQSQSMEELFTSTCTTLLFRVRMCKHSFMGHLQSVHGLHCYSSSQLLFTLSKIKHLISDRPAINLVFIDNIGSFYRIDRYEWGTPGSMVYPDKVLGLYALQVVGKAQSFLYGTLLLTM